MGGVQMGGGDSSEMGLVMKGKQKLTNGIGASLTKKIDERYWCQPHPGLQG